MLDLLSGRRLRLGFGRGLARREFEAFRLSMDESQGRFDEAAPMIVNALKTGSRGMGSTTSSPNRKSDRAHSTRLMVDLRGRIQRGLDRFHCETRCSHRYIRRPTLGNASAEY